MAAPAIIIAGTQSGSGKTTIALGLMAALAAQGLRVQPFKCGPDFIDPTLHKLVTRVESRNLDCWMAGEAQTRATFSRYSQQADIAIIEGVMGMYDGGPSSSAALARFLGVPVILVLDVRSAAESGAAVLKGFEMLAPDVAPLGVILNRVASPRHLELISTAIKEHCQAEILGYLPRDLHFVMPERHLGLHMGAENPLDKETIARLAQTVEQYIDLDGLRELADHAVMADTVSGALALPPAKARLAVARDAAFCFYYEDNLDLLRQQGVELLFFSPLTDQQLPDNINGIYLGGGYPELSARQLSANTAMRKAIKDWAEDGGMIYAECGGFMYLTQGIIDQDGEEYPMVGVFPVQARMQGRRASLGYRQIILRRDGLFGPAGTIMRGHEFHYSTIAEMPATIPRLYDVDNGATEGYQYKNVLGGYLHLHLGFNPEAVKNISQYLL